MSSTEVHVGQRVYFKHPNRHCRLECTVKSIHPEILPNGDRAVKIQNGDSGDWIVSLDQIRDADAEDLNEARTKYADIITAWGSGLRTNKDIAVKCGRSTQGISFMIAAAMRWKLIAPNVVISHSEKEL